MLNHLTADELNAWRTRELATREMRMLANLRRARGAMTMELPALSHCLVRFYTEQAIRDARVLWNEAQLGPIVAR